MVLHRIAMQSKKMKKRAKLQEAPRYFNHV